MARGYKALTRLARWAGFGVILVGFIGVTVVGIQRTLDSQDREQRAARAAVAAGTPYAGRNEFRVSLKSVEADDAVPLPASMELRVGIAYQDRISYWAEPIDVAACSSKSPSDRETVVISRRSGEVIFAVGPLSVDVSPQNPNSVSTRRPIILIDGSPYSIVGRKSVKKLIALQGEVPAVDSFTARTAGITGEFEIQQLM